MSFVKYGKKSNDILDIKQDFFDKDQELLIENLRQAEIYKQQPRRSVCKNCKHPFGNAFFVKHDIEYYLCERCNHLNGGYEDTQAFVEQLYVSPESDYAKYYRAVEDKQYLERVSKVYNPKVKFLLDCLVEDGRNANEMSYCDIGSGSGHFVYSLKKEFGLDDVRGYEVSEEQVRLANTMLGESLVEKNDMQDILRIVQDTESEVLTMIGVLEHLVNPREFLAEVKKNDHIEYFYLSLPLFSISVYFELVNQNHFNRLLSGGHTQWFCEEYGFDLIGKWSFGADAIDLYRFMLNELHTSCSASALDLFKGMFSEEIDAIQLLFDKKDFSSETHILLKKRKDE